MRTEAVLAFGQSEFGLDIEERSNLAAAAAAA